MMTEHAINFHCQETPLVGILHRPTAPARRGVMMVVGGGPQYRVGGHRQLTLWARHLCEHGFAVFRFDYRGMGDGHGDFKGFEDVDLDLKAALDRFSAEVPDMTEVVLWGECDAASAILFYAYQDPRVKGVVLLNPWVRTQEGEAKAILRHYYLQRVMQPSFWKKLLRLEFNPVGAAASALQLFKRSRRSMPGAPATAPSPLDDSRFKRIDRSLPLPQRLLIGLTLFQGPVMLVLSGRDLIAREFEALVNESEEWRSQLTQKAVTRHDFPDSDHTFSSAAQRSDVVERGLAWLRSW